MKIAVIGGAGIRTPLLIHGLAQSDLPLEEVALYDTDQGRLAVIGPLAAQMARGIRVRTCASLDGCIREADFVFTSIRVGGIEGRARDEAAIVRLGIVGQETVGPGGFAMAMRTVAPMIRYAREIAAASPRAWIVNFTNPVGIITQAVHTATGARIIGICDTPTELFHEAAGALGLEASECYYDYFGLNHLGWLREIYHQGQPQLKRLWDDPKLLAGVYRRDLFEIELLLSLRLLPTEYLYYYYRPRLAAENLRRAGTTRGAVIAGLNQEFFANLGRPGADSIRLYEDYLSARDSGYMQIESGSSAPAAGSPWAALTGYDKIALSVVRAVHFNARAVIPLDVPNRGNLPFLDDEDIVEVPCVVDANGALPLSVAPVPETVRPLILRVKEYERRTVRAAQESDRRLALQALAANPLVPDAAAAEALINDLELT
jgi:6-phospho-beta-glucosidase